MSNVPDPDRPGHFLCTQERLVRRLVQNSLGDDTRVRFFLGKTEIEIASIYPNQGGTELFIEFEEVARA